MSKELNQKSLKTKALSIAHENFDQRRQNQIAQSIENGCHGVLGVNTERTLRELFLVDYLNSAKGITVKSVRSEKPYVLDPGGR